MATSSTCIYPLTDLQNARLACLRGAQPSLQASSTAPIACSCSCLSAAVACSCFPAPCTALQMLPAETLLFPVQLPCCCLQMLPPPIEVGKVGQHRMEVRGLLPPWVVTRLVSAIAAAHDQPWQVCSALSRAHSSRGTLVVYLPLGALVLAVAQQKEAVLEPLPACRFWPRQMPSQAASTGQQLLTSTAWMLRGIGAAGVTTVTLCCHQFAPQASWLHIWPNCLQRWPLRPCCPA